MAISNISLMPEGFIDNARFETIGRMSGCEFKFLFIMHLIIIDN